MNSSYGVMGSYKISVNQSRILPVAPVVGISQMAECCFWDMDIDLSGLRSRIHNEVTGEYIPLEDCSLKNNSMVLNNQSLDGPELLAADGNVTLSLSPCFDFTFSTDSYTAQIGVIHLVKAIRFITLENGTEISLLNTHGKAEPVLYLEGPSDDLPVKLVLAQQESNVTRSHTYRYTVSQPIPETIGGSAVASVTVLEQYHSYFMQRAIPFDDQLNMWIPLYAPISWGWSIRVGRRADEEWGILKRKLILPTTGHEGLQLPVWNDNTINCLIRP